MTILPFRHRDERSVVTAEMIAAWYYNIRNGLGSGDDGFRPVGNSQLLPEHICLHNYSPNVMRTILSQPDYIPFLRAYLGKNDSRFHGSYFLLVLVQAILCPEYTAEEMSELIDLLVQHQYPLYSHYLRVFGPKPIFLAQEADQKDWLTFLNTEGYIDHDIPRMYSRRFLEYFLAWHIGEYIYQIRRENHYVPVDRDKLKRIFTHHGEIIAMGQKRTIQDDIYNMWSIPFEGMPGPLRLREQEGEQRYREYEQRQEAKRAAEKERENLKESRPRKTPMVK